MPVAYLSPSSPRRRWAVPVCFVAVTGLLAGGCPRRFAGACGDGVVDPSIGEQCDDGNIMSGDGCSALCATEPMTCGDGVCDMPGGETCANCMADCVLDPVCAGCGDGICDLAGGETCTNCANDCATDPACASSCGDGVVAGIEACDGADLAGADCISLGFDSGSLSCDGACNFDTSMCMDTPPTCGDGVTDAGEDCDDMGVSATCDADCTFPVCGDGTLNTTAGEQCDDGNMANGDGCSSACVPEVMTTCGDGNVEPGESCDDGNTMAGDGCNSVCVPEATFSCMGSPSMCIGSPTQPGDLVITEIMPDPTVVNDANGEWFEVYNPTAATFDLMGVMIQDDGSDSFTVSMPLVVAPGGYLVFGVDGSTGTNGGLPVDYDYSGMNIANSADEIEIFSGGVSIDRVAYDNVSFSIVPGYTMMLSGPEATFSATTNDSGGNWCNPMMSVVYGGGDHGTPGMGHPSC